MKQAGVPCLAVLVAAIATLILAAPGAGQTDAPPPAMLRVFLDCEDSCDFDYVRREIPFVSWVLDREDAHVHVLVTEQRTGGGGEQVTLEFIGRERFDGTRFRLMEQTAATAVRDEIREAITGRLKLGLVRFVADTEAADRLEITYRGEPGAEMGPGEAGVADDAWNAWVFRVGASGSLSGESLRKENSFGGRLTADRVTAEWKHSFYVDGEWEHQRITYYDEVSETQTDTVTYTDDRYSWGSQAMSVLALGPHWSVGGRVSSAAESRYNQDLTITVGPALEYNIFPYDQSDRRRLTFVYAPGVRYVDYTELTLFEKMSETLPGHQLTVEYDATEPWGGGSLQLDMSQYLHDPSKYSAELRGYFNVRILRGLDFEGSGSVEWIRDQLFLPMEGETREDVLLQRRQLATNYEYGIRLGLSYRFGSSFNNIVNPRLQGHGNFF